MRRETLQAMLLVLLLGSAGATRHVAAIEPLDSEQVSQLVRGFLESWESNDHRAFADALHEDVEFAYPGDRLGKAELIGVFRRYQQEKCDIRIYFGDQFIVDGDRFAFTYQFAATDRESGKRQAVGTGVVGRIADGRIVKFKEYYDENVAYLQYADRLPLDEGTVAPWPSSVWLRPETID